MVLRGKRWIYHIDRHELRVENAWSWTGWAQERVILDGVQVASTGGDMTFGREFHIDLSNGRQAHVKMSAGLTSVICTVRMGGETYQPLQVDVAKWTGQKGEWRPDTGSDVMWASASA